MEQDDSFLPSPSRLQDTLSSLVREHLLVFVMGGLGLVILGYGLFQYLRPSQPIVEIVKNEEDSTAIIFVDVSGAVENPGVYQLDNGSRIGEALVAAGGLASSADREWVSRFVNLAAEIEDGTKLYIPTQNELDSGTSQVSYTTEVVGGGEVIGVSSSEGININTASASELDSLWGIGPARAEDIISNRPYGSIDELLSKARIPSNVYDRIKDEVSVY